ncbi:Fic family protein [Nocardia harenae]|uniref:Fic family protein n=1 Tax=Nocardia harenae TaxID=358707 RepID=UPI00083397CF|nr:Fic family protein [Nocardia harenae]
MSFAPGYGQTPLTDDEAEMLVPAVRQLIEGSGGKAAVYDLEQAIQEEVAEELIGAVFEGTLLLDDLLTDYFVRDLHQRLYKDIWQWAGTFRRRELNIGVAPEQIAVELRTSLDSIEYRWNHTSDWTSRQLGIAVHAETVRIHPFTDGNGRTTRLLADLVYAAVQDSESPELYDWELDKQQYIHLLREYDGHRDCRALAVFIGTSPVEG